MSIGELEAALGMPRANIRLYEQEGYIHPRRGANNYRDYTEEDADTLRKVKLLRQLGLSLEEIRQAQRGERPLAALLGEQEAALARRRAELDWAGQVCRAMREDGVEFATLDAHRYLSRLDRPADQPGFFDLRADAAPTVSHPWRRYFARGLDYSLCSFLWMVVCLFLFRWFPENNWGVRLLNAYAAYGILLAAEPLLLCTWGYTPGKWIFGLAVRNRDGGKLTWGRALSRTWGVFARGEGYGIPIYVLWRNYKCWRRCRDGEPEDWEEDTSYTMKDESGLRIGGFAAARAALFGLSLLLALQATLMPLHRGPLTPEEYAANVNDWCRRLDVCSGGILGMGETWEDRIDMALDLAALGIGSIPLNILRPIPGTPFGDLEPITNEEVLRAVAIFRYLNPTAWIRMAAGRGQFSGGGAELFRSGANAAITGDMLTTTGTSMAGDAAMFRALGYQL